MVEVVFLWENYCLCHMATISYIPTCVMSHNVTPYQTYVMSHNVTPVQAYDTCHNVTPYQTYGTCHNVYVVKNKSHFYLLVKPFVENKKRIIFHLFLDLPLTTVPLYPIL